MMRRIALCLLVSSVVGCGSSAVPAADPSSRDPVSCSGDRYCIQDGHRVANPAEKPALRSGEPCKWNKGDQGADNGSYRVLCQLAGAPKF